VTLVRWLGSSDRCVLAGYHDRCRCHDDDVDIKHFSGRDLSRNERGISGHATYTTHPLSLPTLLTLPIPTNTTYPCYPHHPSIETGVRRHPPRPVEPRRAGVFVRRDDVQMERQHLGWFRFRGGRGLRQTNARRGYETNNHRVRVRVVRAAHVADELLARPDRAGADQCW
jgi:hypothetical protein